MSFNLRSITHVSSKVIKITFTDIPRSSDPGRLNDSLNIQNYTISGPGVNVIVVAAPVSSDPFSVSLFLLNDLEPDLNWNISAANIESTLGDTIDSTFVLTFESKNFPSSSISSGNVTDTAEQVIRKHLNPTFVGKNWNALIAAIATGEQLNYDNAKLAFDQLFISSASEKYLDQRGSGKGLKRPKNIGINDENYRKYITRFTNKKLTSEALNEILEIFYGIDGTHAFSITENAEPYALVDGYELNLIINGNTSKITFNTIDFANISSASSLEAAVAINKDLDRQEINAIAIPYTDPTTENIHVKVISGELGIGSSVQILGDQAQNILKFPTWLDLFSAGPLPTWTITKVVGTNDIKFTTTTSPTGLNIATLQIGDYVNIFGNEFNSNNRGTYIVKNVSIVFPLTQSFDVENISGVAEVVAQSAEESILYFRPTKKTIYSISPLLTSFVSQNQDGSLDVVLPATSSAVNRHKTSGAYLQDNSLVSLTAATKFNHKDPQLELTTTVPHGLVAGQQILFKNPVSNLTLPSTTAGTVANPGSADYSWKSIWSTLFDTTYAATNAKSVRFSNGQVLSCGGIMTGVATDQLTLFTITGETFQPNGRQLDYEIVSNLMTIERLSHAVSTIRSGALAFITGGYNIGALSSCEKYDPFNDLITVLASMNGVRFSHAQTTLNDGKVLVCGGNDGVTPIASVEIYDPGTNIWTTVSSMNISRQNHFAFTLPNGKVLVCGGQGSAITDISHICEIYDPVGDVWTFTGLMSLKRGLHSSNGIDCIVQIPDGRVLVTGGDAVSPITGSAPPNLKFSSEIYDWSLGYWTSGPNLLAPSPVSSGYKAILISDENRVLLIPIGTTTDVPVQYIDLKDGMKVKKTEIFVGTTVGADTTAQYASDGAVVLMQGAQAGVPAERKIRLYITGSDTFADGSLTQKPFEIFSIPAANKILIKTPELPAFNSLNITDLTIIPMEAGESDEIPGPFLWDPKSGPSITGIETTLSANLLKNNFYSEIEVASTTGFPSSGYLIFNFGHSEQVFPVRYFAIISATKLSIDSSFKFPVTIQSGNSVNLLLSNAPYDPSSLGKATELGSFYLTDSPSGRIAAENAVDQLIAGGTNVNKNIIYPGSIGLGGDGYPVSGEGKLSDVVKIWGSSED